MKSIVFLFLAIGSLAFSQNVPTHSYHYNWDDINSQWDTIRRYDFTYTYVAGQARSSLEDSQIKDSGNWYPYKKTRRGYDAVGNENKIVAELWNAGSGSYDTTSIFEQDFDAQGNRTRSFFRTVNTLGGPLDTLGLTLWTHTYNGMGQLEETLREDWDYISGLMEPAILESYRYRPNGERDSLITMRWENGGWAIYKREFDYVWYAPDVLSEVLAITYSGFSNSISKIAYEYTDTLGSYIMHRLGAIPANSPLDSIFKNIVQFDQQGNIVHSTSYRWDLAAFGYLWDVETLFQYNYSGAGDLLETIRQERFAPTTNPENTYRITYHDFITDREPPAPLLLAATWAPQPIGEQGFLYLESRPGKLFVEVLDVQGKMVRAWERFHTGGSQQHAFDMALPSGVYLYRMHLNGRVASGRLLVK